MNWYLHAFLLVSICLDCCFLDVGKAIPSEKAVESEAQKKSFEESISHRRSLDIGKALPSDEAANLDVRGKNSQDMMQQPSLDMGTSIPSNQAAGLDAQTKNYQDNMIQRPSLDIGTSIPSDEAAGFNAQTKTYEDNMIQHRTLDGSNTLPSKEADNLDKKANSFQDNMILRRSSDISRASPSNEAVDLKAQEKSHFDNALQNIALDIGKAKSSKEAADEDAQANIYEDKIHRRSLDASIAEPSKEADNLDDRAISCQDNIVHRRSLDASNNAPLKEADNLDAQVISHFDNTLQSPSLEIEKAKSSNGEADLDTEEKNYEDSVIQRPSLNIGKATLSNEAADIDAQAKLYQERMETDGLKQMKNKFRMRRKPYKKRKFRENRERRSFDYEELRNLLKHDFDESKKSNFDDDEIDKVPEVTLNAKNFAARNHLPVNHWRMRRLQKLRELREKIMKENNLRSMLKNEKDTTRHENAFGPKENTPNEGYILIPEDDQIIVVKNMNFTQAIPETQNEIKQKQQEQQRKFLMSVQGDNPNIKIHGEQEVKNKYKSLEENDDEQQENEKLQYAMNVDKDNKNKIGNPVKPDLMKLNISINGLILNNERPSQLISGNGTIKFHPRFGDDRKRSARAFKIPFLTNLKKKDDEDYTTEKDVSNDDCSFKPSILNATRPTDAENIADETPHFPDMDLTPERLSNEIVKMVSHMVNGNPEMKTLWPSLKENQPTYKSSEYNLRFEANRSSHEQIEQMLRQTMATVNDIIQKEVQSRSCVPLTDDLAEFYEAILEMHAKQAKSKEEREELLAKTDSLDVNSDEDTKKKSKPKSKFYLFDNNEELHYDDADDEALYGMMHSRKLQFEKDMADVRHRRELEKKNFNLIADDTCNSSLTRKMRHLFSAAFLKLNSRAGSLQNTNEYMGAEV